MSLYSVVVPVYNSEHTLQELYTRLEKVFREVIKEEFELILVTVPKTVPLKSCRNFAQRTIEFASYRWQEILDSIRRFCVDLHM